MASGPCACGRPYARIRAIDGRREDYLRLRGRDGGLVNVHAGRIAAPLSGVAGLRQFQLVPTGDGLRLRVAIREGAAISDVTEGALRVVKASLTSAGAEVALVAVDVVDRIETAGTGAKQKLVGGVESSS
jgi:phenylacetate-coenzyme A ligase PaaK-like adenylate-forming protein